jgi:hypothetical protein
MVPLHGTPPPDLHGTPPPPHLPPRQRIAVTEVQLRGQPARLTVSPDASPVQEACAEDRRCVAKNTFKKVGCVCACKLGFFGDRCESATPLPLPLPLPLARVGYSAALLTRLWLQ